MTEQQFNEELDDFQSLEVPQPEEIQQIIISFLDFLEEKCRDEKIDGIRENIEERIKDDKFGVIPFIINFIKLKRKWQSLKSEN